MPSFQDIIDKFHPGMRILLHAGPSESLALQAFLEANAERCAGVTFCGLFIPGVTRFDYAALSPTTRIECVFANPAFRASQTEGRLDLLPIHYSAYPGMLARNPVDLAILQLPPAQNGVFSCGLAADIAEGVRAHAKRVAVLVNPEMPFTPGGIALRADEADVIIDAPAALREFPSEAGDDAARTIAGLVAGLVDHGDCVQIGIGKVPAAILRALSDHRNLSLYTGMIVDEVADLAQAGALKAGQAIVTGIGLGTKRLHDFAKAGQAAFHGIARTHDALKIAAQANFISINSAIEIDLFGAINCESVRGRAISGVGGGTDYMRAARLAPQGRSVIALGAQAKGISRIVPRLDAGATSIARADIDILVTEYGVARLRDLCVDARAKAIIALAAPEHRVTLAQCWREMRAKL